jgi:outer membrane lipoprotein-sorting protein
MIRRYTVTALAATILGSWAARPGMAQNLAPSAIVAKVRASQESAKDLQFHARGQVIQGDKVQTAEIEVQAIPKQQLRRVTFKAPAALAGNIVVIDKDKAYRYLALPHQVFVSSVEAATRNAPLDFSEVAKVLDGSLDDVSLKTGGTEKTASGKAHILEAQVAKRRYKVWILDGTWRMHRLQAYDAAGDLKADLTVDGMKTDAGLKPATLKALPEDAEVVER